MALDLAPAGTVASVELRRVRLPLIEPFVAAHGTEHDREVVLVHLVGDDGEHGWGECVALSAPTYSAETTDSSWTVLADRLVPDLLAGVHDAPAAPAGHDQPSVTHPMAWTAVETARADLALRRAGRS